MNAILGVAEGISWMAVMREFLLRLPRRGTGLDQAVHNYVLHRRLVANARLVSNGAGIVATLGLVPRADVGAFLGAAVLHQYDRHPTSRPRSFRSSSSACPPRARFRFALGA